MGPSSVVVTDLDRTFTRLDLSLDERALAAARRLRQAGFVVVLATGRRAQDVLAWPALRDAFDGFVLECGAVWGPWGDWRTTGPSASAAAVRSVAAGLRAAGCANLEEGVASCSAPADWEAWLGARPERPRLALQPNRDRIDVVPAGIDKAAGLDALLRHLGREGARVLAVGDGENDLPLFAASAWSVAVANAAPVVRQAALEVAPHAAADGFVWLAERLLEEVGPLERPEWAGR